MSINQFFEQWDFVDLTHPISESIPTWPNDPPVKIERKATIEKDGYALNQLVIGEQSGTHIGCPAHFLIDGRRAEQYEARELFVPTIVINVENRVLNHADYVLTIEDVLEWENVHGRLEAGHLLSVFTGWSRFWSDSERYLGIDNEGIPHFPGLGPEVTDFLVHERKVVGLGIDTHGIDTGNDNRFEANRILFRANCFHLENLANLDKLPHTGSILVIGMLPLVSGAGSPARILALVPKKV